MIFRKSRGDICRATGGRRQGQQLDGDDPAAGSRDTIASSADGGLGGGASSVVTTDDAAECGVGAAAAVADLHGYTISNKDNDDRHDTANAAGRRGDDERRAAGARGGDGRPLLLRPDTQIRGGGRDREAKRARQSVKATEAIRRKELHGQVRASVSRRVCMRINIGIECS